MGNHTRHKYTHARSAKKLRRRLFISLFCVSAIVLGYGISSLGKNTSAPPTETTTLQTAALVEDMQLAWPVVGQAAIGSVENGLIARSSDNEEPRPTASMAKVITALAIMEKQPFKLGQTGQTYTLTAKDVANYRMYVAKNGSVMPVYEGMILTQYQALQAMLIASSNNIADTLVERTFGSKEAYIVYAQNMLKRMGLSKTTVVDASGYNPATVSTPSELITIGITALKNPVIADIVAQPQAQVPGAGTLKNTNELLGTDGALGIKTGTTNEAGSCLLFAARYETGDGRKITIVGVIMGDTDATQLFDDSRQLLTSAKQSFEEKTKNKEAHVLE
jgi:D-alanyl-D-alanine carboxypeptidase (penicillin-binding protein 5/6)